MDALPLGDGRFRIGEEVASGGMGRIHRAHDTLTGEVVALKVLLDDNADARARFVRECRALAAIQHPGIVRYVAHGHLEGGAPYLAMEWLEGIDLRTRLGRRGEETRAGTSPPNADGGELSFREIVVLGRRIASALHALHLAGLVHRDVKPANIFLPGGQVEHAKLLDLGTTRHGAVRDVTGTGMLVGTVWYMAPEQARADREIGPPADVFALGCVLYECLTGLCPFRGDNVMAALTKILFDDPFAPIEVAPAVPRDLSDLVALMLRKEASERPKDGGAAARALETIEAKSGARLPSQGEPATSPSTGARRAAIGEGEVRVACLLVARGDDLAKAVRQGESTSGARETRPMALGDRFGSTLGSIAREMLTLADGSLVLRPGESLLPRDQAERAARAALALRAISPTVRVAMAMGQATGGRAPVGEVVDRAALVLRGLAPGVIGVDALVASLLAGRFVVSGSALVEESAREVERTLLGKPTTLVGRRRELAMLEATLAESIEESVARAVLLTGAAGMGKSRLLRELGRALTAGRPAPFVLTARGDSAASGSPYLLLAPAVRRAAGIDPGDALPERRAKIEALALGARDHGQVAVFLGELAGVPFEASAHPALAAARADASLLAERIRSAFVELLSSMAKSGPVVLILDDLHWGDLPSVRLVEAAISALAERPLFVLALARPEVRSVFPELFASHGATAIQLDGLSPRASAELVRQALGEVPQATLDAIVQRASGNAFHLEELIRAAAEGDGALPDTLLATLQSRVLALSPEARRVLRAASVFGEACTARAVEALVDGSSLAFGVEDWLTDLAHKELLSTGPPAAGGRRELRFRHALVRDAVYAMLTDEDRVLGHALAGAYLERNDERDALLLAGHFLAAQDQGGAVRWLVRAADQALDGNDLDAAVRHAERALAEGATNEARGRAHAIAATAAYWKNDYQASASHGDAALASLAEGSATWLMAAGAALVSLARTGERDRFDALFERVLGVEAEERARAEQITALCRGTFQLVFAGRFAEADRVLARIAALRESTPELDARTLAQSHHVTGVRAAMVGDVGTFLVHLSRAVEEFERAGDLRNVLLERTTVGWCWAELGQPERAVEMITANLARALEARAPQAITYAKVNLGYALSELPGREDEAEEMLADAVSECCAVRNVRLEGWARAHFAGLAVRCGRAAEAIEQASEATGLLAASPGLSAWSIAIEARARAAAGDAAGGLVLAERAMTILGELGGLLQGETLPPLALAECLASLGHPGAEAAMMDARSRLEARAARLPDPAWRTTFLARADSKATLALTR